MKNKILLLILLLGLFIPRAASATCLSAAAASLAVGSWTEVSSCMTGLDAASGVFDSASNGVFAFTDSMTYDPIGKQVYFAGRGHDATPNVAKFIRYDDATNSWVSLGNVQGCPAGAGHAYDHNTIDQVNRIYYYRCNDSNTYVSYNIATATWSSFAGPTGQTIPQGGVAWFPERNGLFYTFGPGNAVYIRVGTTWTNLGTFAQGQDTGAFAEYSPTAQTVFFGGGTSCPCGKIWKYTANGTISALTDAPVSMAINISYISADSTTGKFLVLSRSGGSSPTSFYSVDTAGSGTWTSLSLPPFSIDGNTGMASVGISTYGVNMYCTYLQGGNARCYVYKLAASGGGDVTAPTITINTPTSSPTYSTSTTPLATLSGTASDNIGVTSVTWTNNRGGSGTATGLTNWSVSNITLLTGDNVLTVTALDAAGNSSTDVLTVTYSTGGGGGGLPYTLPTIANETAAYALWGWSLSTFATNINNPTTITENLIPYAPSGDSVAVHDESEGDELWAYIHMSRRGGSSMYTNRAAAWLTYFKTDYPNCTPNGGSETLCQDIGGGNTLATVCPNPGCANLTFSGDHMYGWGLVDQYQLTADSGALAAAVALGTWIELYYADKSAGYCLGCWSFRQGARHLYVATRLAEATGATRWINLRDKLLSIWQNDPAWDNVGGGYSMNSNIDSDSAVWALLGTNTPTADGWRGAGSFQVSILADAFYQAYRATGQTWIKDRLVRMAQNVQAYALNPAWGNGAGRTGLSYYWNIKTGQANWYGTSFGSPGYTLTLTNTLVLGYKYSGITSLMDLAKHVFAQGSKFDLDGTRFCAPLGYTCATNPDNDPVHHYINTVRSTAGGNPTLWMYFLKGELQYTYLIFENGGAPTVVGGVTPPSGLSVARRRTQ